MSNNTRIFIILAILNFTHILDFMVVMPMGEKIMSSLRLTPEMWSKTVASYGFFSGIGSILSIFIIGLFERKKLLSLVYSGFIIGTLLTAFANSYYSLLISRAISGFFGGIIGSLVLAIITDTAPIERRGRAVGFITTGFSMASALGVPLGMIFASKYHWHYPFFGIVIIAFILLFFIKLYIPILDQHLLQKRRNPLEIIKSLFSDSNGMRALLFLSLLIFGQMAIIPFITPFMTTNIGFQDNHIILMYLIGGCITFFSSNIIGYLSDKFNRKRIVILFTFMSILPMLLLTNLSAPSPLSISLIITVGFIVLITGRMVPSQAMVISASKPENRGEFMGMRSAVQSFSAALGSFVSGFIIYEIPKGDSSILVNYNWVGYISILFSIAAIFLVKNIKAKS